RRIHSSIGLGHVNHRQVEVGEDVHLHPDNGQDRAEGGAESATTTRIGRRRAAWINHMVQFLRQRDGRAEDPRCHVLYLTRLKNDPRSPSATATASSACQTFSRASASSVSAWTSSR